MSRDFFLFNRCYQVGKLCSGDSKPIFPLPPASQRSKFPAKLTEFYALLDRICLLATGSASGLGKLDAADGPTQLQESQRRDLEEFERAVVALRFSDDAAVKQPVVGLIRAIFADAAYFSGLKPLPQYTDAFAYELLFPSWLNLLKACMLPRAGDGKPRLEGERQGALFEFLTKMSLLSESDERMLVGFLTFLASRFDAPQCEEMLQRMVDLIALEGGAFVASLDSIDMACKDARELRERLADFLVVKFALLPSSGPSEHAIAYKRPGRRAIPEILSTKLKELEATQQWNEYFLLAGPLRRLIESPHALSPEFVVLLNRKPEHIESLLSLLVSTSSDSGSKVLCDEGQECVATLTQLQPNLIVGDFARLRLFTDCVAQRLNGFGETAIQYFRKVLIDDEGGRNLLLASCGDTARQGALADQLLARAGKTDDNHRFLKLLACVCIVSPQAEASAAKTTLQAMEAVVANRSIGNKELSDLIGDLQSNYQQSINYLAIPMMAAAGKSPRLAALYLTLNEISEKLSATGTVDNFSVVRAKYSKLTNMEFD